MEDIKAAGNLIELGRFDDGTGVGLVYRLR
jgi:hypothetical protein